MTLSIHHNESLFRVPFCGKIRDPLHDSIDFTEFEKKIIDSAYFQRLRRIKQTSFTAYVFPGATHTRFEHSLGAMHIAGLAYFALIHNQSSMLSRTPELQGALEAIHMMKTEFYLFQCFRFAALLHDVGHSALSHSGEKFMVTHKVLEEQLDELDVSSWLKQGLKKKMSSLDLNQFKIAIRPIRHEIYSLMCVDALFRDDSEVYLSRQMGQDICAILDSSIPPAAHSPLEKSHLRTLFHEMISGEIDVDRMDYLLRDSRMCGVVYGHYDLPRLLDSIGCYQNPETKNYHLAIRRSGVSAFDDFLRARLSMYNQVYFHKTATACEAMLDHIHRLKPDLTFPLDLKSYFNLDDTNIAYFLKIDDEILENLFSRRVLWKKVFEESVPKNGETSTTSLCPRIQKMLLKKGIPCEIVESTTNLTRFVPNHRRNGSTNPFLVILKDIENQRYLEPISQHSTLFHSLHEETLVKRIFASPRTLDNNSVSYGDIQSEIAKIQQN